MSTFSNLAPLASTQAKLHRGSTRLRELTEKNSNCVCAVLVTVPLAALNPASKPTLAERFSSMVHHHNLLTVDCHANFGLPQHTDDLLYGKPLLLHQQKSSVLAGAVLGRKLTFCVVQKYRG
jgi:hypothetical protein